MTSLHWRGNDLGIIDAETDPREIAERMIELDRRQAIYDTVTFFQINYQDEPETFFEMAVTGKFDGLELPDFMEDMMLNILEDIDNYGSDAGILGDLDMEVVE